MKGLAVLFALGPLVGSALVGFLLFVLLTFPFENGGAESVDRFGLILFGTTASFGFSVALLYAVVAERPRLAIGAFALQVVSAAIVFAAALGKSQHSDDTLLSFAGGVEILGLAAVIACRGGVSRSR